MLCFKALVVIVMGILLSSFALADIYKWTDKKSNVHYSDTMPERRKAGEDVQKTIVFSEENSFELPSGELQQPILYTGYDKPLAFTLESVGLNIKNADYQRVKIGQILSGKNCEKKGEDIYWREGNAAFLHSNIDKVIITEVNKAGYNLNPPVASQGGTNERLTLRAELLKIKLNACQKPQDRTSRNDSYIEVRWRLYDKLRRENVYLGTTEGSSIKSSHSDAFKTERQAINSALAIATNNLLADREFVKHINTPEVPKPLIESFESLEIKLRYASDKSTFRQQLSSLQSSTTTVRNTEGHGSGVVISDDGHILTNAHVIGKDSELIVIYKNREYTAKVVRQEPVRDIALLKIDVPFKLVTSRITQMEPVIGDKLFAIGSPLSEALSHTVTSGILSANRTMYGLDYYQTDTSLNPGNSGGPIYNESGELVAISVSGVFSAGGAGLGINYLIPINDAFAALSIKTRSVVPAVPQTEPSRLVTSATTEVNVKPSLLDKARAFLFGDDTTDKKTDFATKRDWGSAYTFYKQALEAKEKGNFDYAEELLVSAVTFIDNDDFSKDAYLVRDELYFHLPVARARQLVKDHKPDQAKIPVKNVNQYLADHPKRFEYMAQVNQVNEAIEYLKLAINTQAKADLKGVRMFLSNYISDRGELPGSVVAMSELLGDEYGRKFSNKFHLVDYKLVKGNYFFVFEDNKNFEKHEVTVSAY